MYFPRHIRVFFGTTGGARRLSSSPARTEIFNMPSTMSSTRCTYSMTLPRKLSPLCPSLSLCVSFCRKRKNGVANHLVTVSVFAYRAFRDFCKACRATQRTFRVERVTPRYTWQRRVHVCHGPSPKEQVVKNGTQRKDSTSQKPHHPPKNSRRQKQCKLE